MIKLNTQIERSDPKVIDLIGAATEACDAYQEALSLGCEIKELSTVIENIEFTRDIINANGATWYVDNCDPENQFKDLFGTVSVAAAEEGLTDVVKRVWEKIKAFFKEIWDWVKNKFTMRKAKSESAKSALRSAAKKIGESK